MSAAYNISKVNINVRLPEALHLAVKQAVPGRTKTLEKAYEEALTDWLNRGAASTSDVHQDSSQTTDPKHGLASPQGLAPQFQRLLASEETRKYLEMLAAVLMSGNEDAIKAVAQNIEVFADYVRLKGKTASPASHPKRRAK